MGDSLREQMLKKGLATKKQAKAAAKDVRQEATKKRKAGKAAEADVDSLAREAARLREERAEQDKARNRERDAELERKRLKAQARDLILHSRIRYKEGKVAHHFAHGNVVKKLDVDDDMHMQIANGRLAIAVLDASYYVIPAGAAEKLLERAPESVLQFNERQDEGDEDDPYAEYKVPDDLMW